MSTSDSDPLASAEATLSPTVYAATATGGALVGLGLSMLFLWLGKRWHAKRRAARGGEWGEDSKAEQGYPKGSRQDLEGKPRSQSEGRV